MRLFTSIISIEERVSDFKGQDPREEDEVYFGLDVGG